MHGAGRTSDPKEKRPHPREECGLRSPELARSLRLATTADWAIVMNWAAVDSLFHSHRKTVELRQYAAWHSALALWILSLSWCASQPRNWLTGRVPRNMAEFLLGCNPDAAASALVDAGLWEEDSEGWVFHDWDAWNGIGNGVERRRAASRDSSHRHRLKKCQDGKHTKECPTTDLDDRPWHCPKRALPDGVTPSEITRKPTGTDASTGVKARDVTPERHGTGRSGTDGSEAQSLEEVEVPVPNEDCTVCGKPFGVLAWCCQCEAA